MAGETLRTRVAIIGAGVGAICAGARLRQEGIDDFVMLERAEGAGGTWWRNRYPGLECDIPSHLYSFSFARKPDWTKPYAKQPEILRYMQGVVEDFGLTPHIRLRTAVTSAVWDDTEHVWRVGTERDGEPLDVVADVLVASPGMFGALNWPDIPGRESFEGTAFHTGAWDANCSLEGKRVAVIGSAGSAVQLIPEVAKVAAQLHVFQRSANWVLPKDDIPFTEEELERFRNDPSGPDELREIALDRIGGTKPFSSEEARQISEQLVRKAIEVVDDPVLRAKLTPTVPWGCQRPLFSNVYYPTYNRPNVELVTDGIERITPRGVVTVDGVEREVDVIIYATGYETTKYVSTIDITGRDGLSIHDAWADGPLAYLGITMTGFPNLFMVYGPNTNHGSIIYMIECQVDYIVRALQHMERDGLQWVDVRRDVMDEYNEQLQRDLDEVTVWDAGCSQYYRVPSGRIVTQWPHKMFVYRDLTAVSEPLEVYESA